eukprot:CAMPEP_0194090156 /NCGR_PEP_ID=MMETSP0149-20130528/37703_1 /TAXON_ID=122233 /ORGANISM="Chaetoceros debilis, Strain MM31A-1" /LENGTH=385 /DNA_ID=CAMNT_0038774307 /DNA_START=170 /DNA_END=1330 /DNA_ORIENTATION=-
MAWFVPPSSVGYFTKTALTDSRGQSATISNIIARRRGRRHFLAKESSEHDNNNISTSSTTTPPLSSFISEPFRLWIEDTDAYGVKFNANYIRSYERALYQFAHKHRQLNNWDSSSQQGGVLIQYPDFYLTKVTNHKFRISPGLGEEFVITGERIEERGLDGTSGSTEDDESTETETWSLEMLNYTEEDSSSEKVKTSPLKYNNAVVTIAAPKKIDASSKTFIESFIHDDDMDDPSLTILDSQYFALHRDEFDLHMPGIVPIRTALTLFERSRSTFIGGPDALRRMQEDDNLLWVVTSVDDMAVNTSPGINADILPGTCVRVDSVFELKRKGMIIECKQQIVTGSVKDSEVVISQGIVTLCAIDSVKKRPTKIPEHVRDTLMRNSK